MEPKTGISHVGRECTADLYQSISGPFRSPPMAISSRSRISRSLSGRRSFQTSRIEARPVRRRHPNVGGLSEPPEEAPHPADAEGLEVLVDRERSTPAGHGLALATSGTVFGQHGKLPPTRSWPHTRTNHEYKPTYTSSSGENRARPPDVGLVARENSAYNGSYASFRFHYYSPPEGGPRLSGSKRQTIETWLAALESPSQACSGADRALAARGVSRRPGLRTSGRFPPNSRNVPGCSGPPPSRRAFRLGGDSRSAVSRRSRGEALDDFLVDVGSEPARPTSTRRAIDQTIQRLRVASGRAPVSDERRFRQGDGDRAPSGPQGRPIDQARGETETVSELACGLTKRETPQAVRWVTRRIHHVRLHHELALPKPIEFDVMVVHREPAPAREFDAGNTFTVARHPPGMGFTAATWRTHPVCVRGVTFPACFDSMLANHFFLGRGFSASVQGALPYYSGQFGLVRCVTGTQGDRHFDGKSVGFIRRLPDVGTR